jgi:hypothetical protein
MASEWRPIESAPKDGTKIDVWRVRLEYGTAEQFDGERVPNAWWGEPYRPGSESQSLEPQWLYRGDGICSESATYESERYRVTHWMPLPNPPA